MNAAEVVALIGVMYDSAYYYLEKIRQTIQSATIGKRNMVCLNNGCWLEESYNIPDDWVQWKYNSDTHELVNNHGPTETDSLGWLSVFHNDVDISPFFVSLRCGKSENTKYVPTDSMVITLFALQSGVMPKGAITIILSDASEKTIQCSSLFTIHPDSPEPSTDLTEID